RPSGRPAPERTPAVPPSCAPTCSHRSPPAPAYGSSGRGQTSAYRIPRWERRIDRDRLREFLVRFHEERPAEDGDQAWAGWLQAIALLGLRDLVPLVDLANGEPPA